MTCRVYCCIVYVSCRLHLYTKKNQKDSCVLRSCCCCWSLMSGNDSLGGGFCGLATVMLTPVACTIAAGTGGVRWALQHALCQLNLAHRPCSDCAARATCSVCISALLACSASNQTHCLRRAVALFALVLAVVWTHPRLSSWLNTGTMISLSLLCRTGVGGGPAPGCEHAGFALRFVAVVVPGLYTRRL